MRNCWHLYVSLKKQEGQDISLHLTKIYGRFPYSMAALVLYDIPFLHMSNTIFMFARLFENAYGLSFLEDESSDIAKDLLAANFRESPRATSCLQHTCITSSLCSAPILPNPRFRKRAVSLWSLICTMAFFKELFLMMQSILILQHIDRVLPRTRPKESLQLEDFTFRPCSMVNRFTSPICFL